MVQINAKTKFERDVIRRVEKLESQLLKRQNSPLHGEGDNEGAHPKFVTTQMSLGDEDSHDIIDDVPRFPRDLVDQRTGDVSLTLTRPKPDVVTLSVVFI